MYKNVLKIRLRFEFYRLVLPLWEFSDLPFLGSLTEHMATKLQNAGLSEAVTLPGKGRKMI